MQACRVSGVAAEFTTTGLGTWVVLERTSNTVLTAACGSCCRVVYAQAECDRARARMNAAMEAEDTVMKEGGAFLSPQERYQLYVELS